MRIALSFIVVAATLPLIAHPRADELAVVEGLVRMIMSSPEWEDDLRLDSAREDSDLPFQTYEDLFSVEFPTNHVGATWSPQERKLAFENFIEAIPDLSTNGMYRAIGTHGGVALSYCCEHGASNVLLAAESILTTKHSVAHSAALSVVGEFALPSSQFNAYAMSVFTNSELTTSATRSYFKSTYAEVLRKHRIGSDSESFTNGVMNLYRVVFGGTDGAIALDRLLLETYPEYQGSQERLSLARGALSGRSENGIWSVPAVERYFIPVTNQLMNAAQPLPEVEALRGL